VQEALLAVPGRSYDLGQSGADGDYGSKTEVAVRRFKADESLGFTSIGDVGPGTMRRLDEIFTGDDPVPPAPDPPVLLAGDFPFLPDDPNHVVDGDHSEISTADPFHHGGQFVGPLAVLNGAPDGGGAGPLALSDNANATPSQPAPAQPAPGQPAGKQGDPCVTPANDLEKAIETAQAKSGSFKLTHQRKVMPGLFRL